MVELWIKEAHMSEPGTAWRKFRDLYNTSTATFWHDFMILFKISIITTFRFNISS